MYAPLLALGLAAAAPESVMSRDAAMQARDHIQPLAAAGRPIPAALADPHHELVPQVHAQSAATWMTTRTSAIPPTSPTTTSPTTISPKTTTPSPPTSPAPSPTTSTPPTSSPITPSPATSPTSSPTTPSPATSPASSPIAPTPQALSPASSPTAPTPQALSPADATEPPPDAAADGATSTPPAAPSPPATRAEASTTTPPRPRWWGPDPRPKVSGYGGPALRLSGLNGKFAAFVGLEGGINILQRLTIGASLQWLLNPVDAGPYARGNATRININYGGLVVDVAYVRGKRVSGTIGGLLGGGGGCVQNPEDGRCADKTAFFVGEPRAGLRVVLAPIVRLHLALGYRLVAARTWTGPANLGGPMGTVMLEFGWF
ncbi:hypothetical protein [Nannocystis punicea]|uniref:Outer membrane protein beta-barrel domain-containing protein n=1 Tax=Nannocystis punicea TaxID=2995304 RepID=A0ABY7H281_9BACT|nr:hypothetical protein [Nannocystis poenicansa]WAS93374.1 hypothetical protein O0S08_45090 [Nannocystis poenicansa]